MLQEVDEDDVAEADGVIHDRILSNFGFCFGSVVFLRNQIWVNSCFFLPRIFFAV